MRLCDRYLYELVLPFGLCPWAGPALRTQRVARAVCLAQSPGPDDCVSFAKELAAGVATNDWEVGLLLFPRSRVTWAAFDGFAERVRRRISVLRQRGELPDDENKQFLIAAFHPDGARSFTTPAQTVSFVRRTADPMLQFVRSDLLARLKATQPDLSGAIARNNFDALARDDATATFGALVADLHDDRARSYRALEGQWAVDRIEPSRR